MSSSNFHPRETTMQWLFDPQTERETFRVIIPIDGFPSNEVSARVNGQRLSIFAERVENKTQGLSKKIVDQSYDLPPDVDHYRYHVTHPSPSTIQIDFPSRFTQRVAYGPSTYSKPRLIQMTESIDRRDPHVSRSKREEIQGQIPIQYRSRSGTPVPVVRGASPDRSSISSVDSTPMVRPSHLFPSDFDLDEFYRSAFQPRINVDERQIEMKLKINSLNPNDLQVSIENNELIVFHPHRSFERRVRLPSNVDPPTLKVRFDPSGHALFRVKFRENYSADRYL